MKKGGRLIVNERKWDVLGGWKWWKIKKRNKFLFRNTFDRLNAVKAFYMSKDINFKGSVCRSFFFRNV